MQINLTLTPEQQARYDSATAARLRGVAEETRRVHELTVLAHACEGGEQRLRELVVASAAADTALDAVANYVARGVVMPRGAPPTDVVDREDPRHELCRRARFAVSEQVQAILAQEG